MLDEDVLVTLLERQPETVVLAFIEALPEDQRERVAELMVRVVVKRFHAMLVDLPLAQRERFRDIATEGLCRACWGDTPCYCERDD